MALSGPRAPMGRQPVEGGHKKRSNRKPITGLAYREMLWGMLQHPGRLQGSVGEPTPNKRGLMGSDITPQ